MLINGLFPHFVNDIIGVEWYVADLLILILLAPVLVRWIKDLKSSILTMFVAMILSAIVQLTYFLFFKDLADYDISTYFKTFCFLIQFPGMLLGVVIYYLTKQKDMSVTKKLAYYAIYTVTVVALFAVGYRTGIRVISHPYVNCAVWGLLVLTCVVFEQKYRDFSIRFARKKMYNITSLLGTYSLGMYLVHMLVIRYFNVLGFNRYCGSLIGWLISFAAIVTISFAVGFTLEKLIGKTQKCISSIIFKQA